MDECSATANASGRPYFAAKHMSDIIDSDITFVVQGPVRVIGPSSTEACLRSVRRLFPGSRIVLSTWHGSDPTNLQYDDVIFSNDPGPIISDVDGLRLANNINRQIVSTATGIRTVTSKFAVKLRSDGLMIGRGFVGFLNAFPWRRADYSLFQDRIVISKEFTRSPRSFVPFAYHPSDLFQFGHTEDLMKYWGICPVTGERLSSFFLSGPPPSWFSMFDGFRYTTEQYLFLDLLNRCGQLPALRDYSEISESITILSQNYLLNNFLPVEPALLGIHHAKFAARAHRSLMEDCIGLREFTSWYAKEISERPDVRPIGNEWPALPLSLRAERILREVLKRIPLFQRLYAKRYLAR
jgi:hypothetical protein